KAGPSAAAEVYPWIQSSSEKRVKHVGFRRLKLRCWRTLRSVRGERSTARRRVTVLAAHKAAGTYVPRLPGSGQVRQHIAQVAGVRRSRESVLFQGTSIEG